eukprot:gb/GEZJ01000750.1/.p1 GENE.gb/GEZJ01000750.1/~~gb/GEZJ01000750.1/.p1  ORF type:complete len:164 (+),score=26.66 gb/GEZJ01000750.1/:414-905(+)
MNKAQEFHDVIIAHREWPLRRHVKKHTSIRPVSEYEVIYINAAGYCMAFLEAAVALCEESLANNKEEDAKKFDIWATVTVKYALQVVRLRCEFYKVTAKDPTQEKLVLPMLEKKENIAAADDLEKPMGRLESHMETQIMKVVAALHASNATHRSSERGSSAIQ